MTVTSADPDRLDHFVSTAPTGRAAAADMAQRGAALSADVASRCAGRGLSGTNFGAVTTLIGNMEADEQFVKGIADALRDADRHDGIATMSDVAVAQQLASGQYDTATTTVTISEVALLGEPPNSGLVDDPICAANGNFIHIDADLAFPGTSAALDVHRFYNSLAADRVGAFGAGWTSLLDLRLAITGRPARSIRAHLVDGAEIVFERDGEGWSTRDRRRHGLVSSAGGWELTVGDDAQRAWRFDRRGRLVGWRVGRTAVDVGHDAEGRITSLTHDRSGRTVQVSWDGARVASLTTDDGRVVSYAYGTGDTLVRAESLAGWFDYVYRDRLMISATDPDGVSEFVNEYDDAGRVTRQTSQFGRVTTYRYEMPGATVITDGAGARQAMVHDARGNLTAIIDTDGAAMRATYDDHDRMVRVVSQTGDVWHHEFDPATGDLVRRTDPDGLSQTWEWDAARRLVATTDRAGGTVRYRYDGDTTAPSRIDGPDGSTVTIERDQWDQPLVVTDPDGVVTRFVWDRDGQLVGVTDALGTTTTMEFDDAGLLVRLVDPNGIASVLERDRAGRVRRGSTAERVHEFRYTPAGRIAGGSDPADGEWSAVFGRHGAVVGLTGAAGAEVAYRYDEIGNVAAVTAADGRSITQEFDDAGRLVRVIGPDGGGPRLVHDPAGRVVAITDAAGRTQRRTIDPLGRTASITAPDGSVTRWTYHPGGEVATVTLADGRVWATEVDAAGRVVAIVDPEGRRAERTYTPAGRLGSRTDPLGRSERFRYDAAGRFVGVTAADGTEVELTLDAAGHVVGRAVAAPGHRPVTETYVLDPHGLPVERTDARGTARWERDAAGRVIAEIDGTGAVRRYEYDPAGSLAAAIDPAGLMTTYRRDPAGRLLEQVAPGGRRTTWEHDALGQVRRYTDPAGVATEATRDATGVVTSLRRGIDGALDIGWDRTLDAVGREVTRSAADGTLLARYAYDATGRIVSAEAPLADLATEFLWDASDHLVAPYSTVPHLSAPAGGRDDDRPRDAAGRLLVGHDGTVFRYDGAGRLVEVVPPAGDATSFEYDADGLIATERVGRQVRRFTHDAAGRITSITVDGAGTSVYTYDTAGRRDSQTGPDGTTVVFGWNDLDQLVSITHAGIDGAVRRLAIDVDALGRPRRINGVEIDPGATSPIEVAGVVVLGARVFDPVTHQFLSADPLKVQPASNGGASAYTYAWHDPVNFIDPSGLRPISIEEYEQMRTLEEQGRLGQAWEAIKEDPWGTVAMVGLVGAAIALGGPVGVGILIGAGMAAGVGLATGTFSPTQVVIGGIVGGASGGVGSMQLGVGSAMLANGAVGAGGEILNGATSPGGIQWGHVLAAGAGGAVTGGIATKWQPWGQASIGRNVFLGTASETAGSISQQVLVGENPASTDTLVAAATGAGNSYFTYDPRVTVYRGTSNTMELAIHGETGMLMSDSARVGYIESNGSMDAALAQSQQAHTDAVASWGSEQDYVQAHGAFGTELSSVGPRSMVSVTTKEATAKYFAGENGEVFTMRVHPDDLIPQTLPGAGESEYLVTHMVGPTEGWKPDA